MRLPAALLLMLAAPGLAWGEANDPPARIAHLSYVEGRVSFDGADAPATTTLPDRPLEPGDRLITQTGRAELAFGTATIRLDEQSELAMLQLDETHARVELIAGSASVYLRELLEDETFEILTPNATIALDEPGEYRLDVAARDQSILTVRAGAAEVAGPGGPVRIAAGQRVRLQGRDAYARLETTPAADRFDEWVLERELRLAEAQPPRYTPYEEEGEYQELDRYGEWYDEPRYGRVWMPNYYYGGLSPYRHGYWNRAGYGWSWINPAPWGYYTFHSGRWAYLNHLNRWCWVPGPRHYRRHYDRGYDRPYRQPRGNPRERPEREDGPRTAGGRSVYDSLRQEAMNNSANARRGDGNRRENVERRPMPQREPASGERGRVNTPTMAPRREPRQAAPVAAQPRSNQPTTMRPARDPGARVQPARDPGPSMRGEVGTWQEP